MSNRVHAACGSDRCGNWAACERRRKEASAALAKWNDAGELFAFLLGLALQVEPMVREYMPDASDEEIRRKAGEVAARFVESEHRRLQERERRNALARLFFAV